MMSHSSKTTSVASFLLALSLPWYGAFCARPEQKLADEVRLFTTAKANLKQMKSSNDKPKGDETLFAYPKTVGMYHLGMDQERDELDHTIADLTDAVHGKNGVEAASEASANAMDKYHQQMNGFQKRLNDLTPMQDKIGEDLKTQMSALETDRIHSFDKGSTGEFDSFEKALDATSIDDKPIRAIDAEKDILNVNEVVEDQEGAEGDEGSSEIQLNERSAHHSSPTHKLRSHHHEKQGKGPASLIQLENKGASNAKPEDDEEHLHGAENIIMNVDKNPGGDEDDFSKLDKEALIKEAGSLVPADKRAAAEKLWRELPDASLRAWMPKYFKNIRAEANMKFLKKSLENSDSMDDAGQNLVGEATKVTNALVNVHKKMQEWHGIVKTNVQDVDKLASNQNGFMKNVLDHLIDTNDARIQDFNKLVGPATIGADKELRERIMAGKDLRKKAAEAHYKKAGSTETGAGTDELDQEDPEEHGEPIEDDPFDEQGDVDILDRSGGAAKKGKSAESLQSFDTIGKGRDAQGTLAMSHKLNEFDNVAKRSAQKAEGQKPGHEEGDDEFEDE